MSHTIMLGRQITASFDGCRGETFLRSELLIELLRKVVKLLDFDEVAHLSHSFTPHGSTCVLILAQSHIIAHTWPEYRTLVLDLFACGEIHFTPAAELIRSEVKAASYRIEKRVRAIEPLGTEEEDKGTPDFEDRYFMSA